MSAYPSGPMGVQLSKLINMEAVQCRKIKSGYNSTYMLRLAIPENLFRTSSLKLFSLFFFRPGNYSQWRQTPHLIGEPLAMTSVGDHEHSINLYNLSSKNTLP